jgi:tetratricopeptide (TPR) repeat protein
LGRKEFDRARALLDELLESAVAGRDVLERARAYRAMCDRVLEKRSARPKSFEELLHYGVLLHNRGDFSGAVRYLRQALEIHPRNESALYCLAAAQARIGDTPAALKALRSAILASPASRTQARQDPDFERLREETAFLALVSPSPS